MTDQLAAGLQRFMALDVGLVRTGVAVGNRALSHAEPHCTIKGAGAVRLEKVAALLKVWEPDALVLGIPFHPDGQAHDMTRHAKKFAKDLKRFGLPVFSVDERYSTTEAHARGFEDVDAGAACVILEQFLRSIECRD